ncbi:YchJ family protein [Actinomadura flavalba]|uniref:YchJ family protein n=1 Tax=Actinomadura flavalba TaxID=1120938 RepID=UPI0003667773|nr:YchJ family metal-binding protein [Actinomadura flavalba]
MAETAVELMRSRYSAFVVGDADYLLGSWHSSTRPRVMELDRRVVWRGLTIERTGAGGAGQRQGTVRFSVAYTEAGRDEVVTEHSAFSREDGAWVYVGPVPGWP